MSGRSSRGALAVLSAVGLVILALVHAGVDGVWGSGEARHPRKVPVTILYLLSRRRSWWPPTAPSLEELGVAEPRPTYTAQQL